ncbi:T9SS type A sorting domain-containing protein [Hymenobacter sp. ASUV-10]|uniref:T9SS type A sorting domain-containing protein n=1 Tax=Hymenobacter aranciens TaxID=3063996 RepID=A0ABT9B8Y6_9BACT|nr:T9SS type A sorting domain-containing protein [Hymenobacter sp. ASUV-10]MDO7873161.1 T9SS type A sorting domain-containing protein [Hymenobacter sp. ASUV-10]
MSNNYPLLRQAATFLSGLARPGRALLAATGLLAAAGPALAQTTPSWQLATSGNNVEPTIGGSSTTQATAVDPATGNVYSTGYFTGTVTFGNTRLVSVGADDLFVAKWDVAAGAFTSAVRGGGATGNDRGLGIAVLSAGGVSSVYVTGYFIAGGTSGTSASIAGTTLPGTGSSVDMFVARYTDAGTGLTSGGARSGGGSGSEIGYGIAAVRAGTTNTVYVTGQIGSGGGTSIAGTTLPGTGSSVDMFVARYTDAGTGLTDGGARSGGGSGTDSGQGIAAVSTGTTTSVYVTGNFVSGTGVSIAGTPLTNTATGTDVFVARYTDDGTDLTNAGAVRGGGPGTDSGQGIAAVSVGTTTSVYVTGYFTSGASTTSASIAGTSLPGTSSGTDVFVAKYTDAGTGLTGGGAVRGGGSGADRGLGITAGTTTSVYVTGYFTSGASTTSASIAGTSLPGTNSDTDVFVAKYTDAGTGLTGGGAVRGGGSGADIGYGIAAAGGTTSVYVGGVVGAGVGTFGSGERRLAPIYSALLGQLTDAGTTPSWGNVEGPLQGGSSETRATTVDAATGNVYVTGIFQGTVGFGLTRLVSVGSYDVFVAKWDARAGAFTSAVSGGGPSDDRGLGIAVANVGGVSSVYVTGSFQSSAASFAGSPLVFNGGTTDLFVARYTDAGAGLVSGGAVGGGGGGSDGGQGIAAISAGGITSVYVTGYFNNDPTVASIAGSVLSGPTTRTKLFVARYTDAGLGLVDGGALSSSSNNISSEFGNGIAAVRAGGITSVYVTGAFASNTSTTIAGSTLANTGANVDMFVARYTDAGTGLAEGGARSGGGAADEDRGMGIAAVSAGGVNSVYVTGYFTSGTGASIAGTTLAGTGTSNDLFVAKYTDAGTGLTDGGARSDGGSNTDIATGNDAGLGIAAESAGSVNNVYVTGYFVSGPGSRIAGTTQVTTNTTDLFVARYIDTGTSLANGGARSGASANNVDFGYGIAAARGAVYIGGSIVPVAAFGSITLVNPAGSTINFLGRVAFDLPTLSSLSASSGAAGSTFAATGTLLSGAAAITFTPASGPATNAPAGYVVASATSITGIAVPAGLSPGTYTLTVTTPNGTTNGLPFTVTAPVSTISSFTPASGPAGIPVTITGTGLDVVTGVRFGTGTLTTNFVSQSATSLTVRVPVVAATGPLTLTDNNGASVSSSTNFTYTPRTDLVATLSPAGPLDACQPRTLTASATTAAFATGTGFDGYVQTVVAQADGKVLVGGSFTTYQGTAASRFIRLNADGSRDTGFNVGSGFNNLVQTVAVQADGKVLVGGNFTQYDGVAAGRLIRLNADGSRDTGFNIGTGFSSDVYAVALQADGKVLVGGLYSNFNNTSGLNRLVRLNADGSRDTGFSIGTGFNGSVAAIAVQADGKVLVGGQFTQYKGGTQNRLMRLNADGSRDAGFTLAGTGFGNTILTLAVQADGKVLAGGQFTSYSGTAANSLVRLNADGSRDAGFTVGTGFNDIVQHLALQADGKVLAVGNFSGYQGVAAGRMARLNTDGSRDTGFTTIGTGFSSTVYAVAVQADGKLLVGGDFARYGGALVGGLTRLTADGSRNDVPTAVSGATFTFAPGGSTTNPLVTSTAGSYTVTASLDGSTSNPSNAVVLTACAVPTLTAINPGSGPIGTSVTLTGTNLAVATSVSFNGTAQTTITNNTATSLTVLVPAGATTGLVTVTTPDGTSNGLTFTVTVTYPDLVISTGTTAAPVAAGTYNSITVTGTGFASLSGAVVVNSAVSISGSLATNCQPLTGAGSFTLNAGATLHICDAGGISASGSTGAVRVTGARSFSPGADYVYDGPSGQVTGSGLPATVRNLSSTNPTTLTLSQALSIRQVLTLHAGDLNTFGQALTLLSDASGTALVASLDQGAILGNVTVQRYIDGSRNAGLGYRHLSAPTTGQTIGSFASGGTAQVVNPAYNTSATPNLVTPFPTVLYYNQARLATSPATSLSAFDKGWASPTGLADAAPIAIRGFTLQLPGASTLSFTGQVGNGNGSIPLSRASGATAADAGWNFIGNPYPSPLDLSTVQASQRTNVDAAVYVWESTSRYGGQYRSYVNGMGGGNPLIGSSQAFWMRVSAGQTSGQLTLNNSNRVTSYAQQAPVRRGAADARPQLTLALAGAGLADELTLYAEAGATAGFDGSYDAAKLPNPHGLNLAALAATGQALAIDGRADFATTTAIPLTVGVPAPGTYTLTAATLANLPADTRAELVDTQTNTRTALTAGTSYTFTMSSTTAPGRFWLNLTPAAAPLSTAAGALAAQALVYPNPAHEQFTLLLPAVAGASQATATLLNSLGQVVSTRVLPLTAGGATATYSTTSLAAGVYALRLQAGAETATLRVVVE